MIPTFPLIRLSAERSAKTAFSESASHQVNTTADGNALNEAAEFSAAVLFAQEVETARQQLQTLLLATPASRLLFYQQLQTQLQQGTETRELWLENTDAVVESSESLSLDYEEPVQNASFVQLTRDRWVQSPESVHFFPTFLQQVAEFISASPPAVKLEKHYLKQLRAAHKTLQQKRQQMIGNHLGLVAFIARRQKPSQISFEDVMQEGIVGLIKAVDRFDCRRNIRFSTYASYWIKQAINRLVIKQDKIVRLPVALAEKAPIVFELMRECYLQQQRWPTLNELKTHSGLSEEELKTLSSYYQSTHQLDPIADEDDDGLALMDRLSQQQFSLPLDELIAQNLVQYLNSALDSLPEKEAAILIMRFGLKNHREMTLQAVADQLHVTRERVRQIQNEALNKLKQQFGCDLILFLEPNDN